MNYDSDFYHEGIGAGASGYGWLDTVRGRFLTQQQRRDLYDGWREGVWEWRERQREENAHLGPDEYGYIPY